MVHFVMKNVAYSYVLMACSVILPLLPQTVEASYHPIHLNCTASNPKVTSSVEQFFNTTSAMELKNDPTRLSLLIAVALHQRYGHNIRVKYIADLMNYSYRTDLYTFLDIKRIVGKIGYSVSAYRLQGAAQDKIREQDVGVLIDQQVVPNTKVFALLFAATQHKKYLLYADGIICPMSNQQFEKRFGDSFFLKFE